MVAKDCLEMQTRELLAWDENRQKELEILDCVGRGDFLKKQALPVNINRMNHSGVCQVRLCLRKYSLARLPHNARGSGLG